MRLHTIKRTAHSALWLPRKVAAIVLLLVFCLLLSTIIVFLATGYYYAIDTRYLIITFFALLVSVVTYLRHRPVPTRARRRTVIYMVLASVFLGSVWTVGAQQRNVPSVILAASLPIESLQLLENGGCTTSTTILNIVAHQDDDLLFMNPNLLQHIRRGDCVRTIYVTAGDAGQNSQYWIRREKGSRAAYDSLLGDESSGAWTTQTIKLADTAFVTVVSPRDNRRISLVFMRLADGAISGEGFDSMGNESLSGLIADTIPAIHSVDGQSKYTSQQLTDALLLLMKAFQPTEINSLATSDEGRIFRDHSDHMTVGRYAWDAYQLYSDQINLVPINFYVGYSVREWPENVTSDDLDRKTAAFKAYGQFDGAACHIMVLCGREPTYWAYLHRQYTVQQQIGNTSF